MKSLIPIVSLGSVLSSEPVDIRIPLTKNHREDLVASIIFPWAESGSLNVTLTSYNHSIVTAVRTSAEVPHMLFHDSRDSSRVRRVEDESMRIRERRTNSTNFSFLGIGLGSAITQSLGSAAVLRYGDDRAQLLLGSSLATFNESCMPNSLMTVNKTELDLQGSSIVIAGLYLGTFPIKIRSGPSDRAMVPETIFERLVHMISFLGGAVLVPRRPYARVRFTNCTRNTFRYLPDLEINLGRENHRFSILPEDYLQNNESNNTCEMRISSAVSIAPEIWLNPLFLVDTNVRFNDNYLIDFCESNGNF